MWEQCGMTSWRTGCFFWECTCFPFLGVTSRGRLRRSYERGPLVHWHPTLVLVYVCPNNNMHVHRSFNPRTKTKSSVVYVRPAVVDTAVIICHISNYHILSSIHHSIGRVMQIFSHRDCFRGCNDKCTDNTSTQRYPYVPFTSVFFFKKKKEMHRMFRRPASGEIWKLYRTFFF